MLPPKPSRFLPAVEPRQARFAETSPPFIKQRQRHRGRRATGIRYETKVQRILGERYGNYIASPWLTFVDVSGRLHWCQPDGFLIDIKKGQIIIIEMKIKHTSDSWWQLWYLYLPVMKAIFPTFEFRVLEVVKWFDPQVVFPDFCMTENILYPPKAPHTGVHILRA